MYSLKIKEQPFHKPFINKKTKISNKILFFGIKLFWKKN